MTSNLPGQKAQNGEEEKRKEKRDQELCEGRGGCPWLSVLKSSYGLCGRKATWNSNLKWHRPNTREMKKRRRKKVKKKKKNSQKNSRVQELCESRGGRHGLPIPYGLCGRKATLTSNLKRHWHNTCKMKDN